MKKFFTVMALLTVTTATITLTTKHPLNAQSESAPSSGGSTTSIEDFYSEPEPIKARPKRTRYCKNSKSPAFVKPCVCARDVDKRIRYRPSLAECDGNAAAIMSGRYKGIFSVVLRDVQNRDRWPLNGANGCSAELAQSQFPPNKCSLFKAQKQFSAGPASDPDRFEVFCFGGSGYSKAFARVTRLTLKLGDSPTSTNDPLIRACLTSPKQGLN
jgi:hypothetical protein